MLNTIKSIINQKKAYLESAELLLEDTELDDSIVLDESPMEIPPAENTEELESEAPEENAGTEEEPLPVEADSLPTPAAEPAGEPVSDDSVDIMTAEIDLATNTQTDILPVPPANANDAIDGEDDIMSQTVDSGFGDDEDKAPIETTTDIMSEPIDELEVQADDNKEQENLDVNTPVGESSDEPSEDDDVMNEAVDDNKIEKSIEEKEKDYLKSYKESGDIMDAPINEAVDDNKIETHEKKLEEQEKKVQSSDPATPGEDGAKTESTKEFTESTAYQRELEKIRDEADTAASNGENLLKQYVKDKNNAELKKKLQNAISKLNELQTKEKSILRKMGLSEDYISYYGSETTKNKGSEIARGVAGEDNIPDKLLRDLASAMQQKDEIRKALTESGDVMMEGISLGDEALTDASADAGSTDAPADAADTPAEDNAVTSAVKDKVDELASTDSIDSGSSITDKEELMKKLSALTKSIEDAKSLVLKGLQ